MELARSWTLIVRGDSMRALLKAGDVIRVRRAPLSELHAGDLAILIDWRGGRPDYVVHRLLGRIRRGGALRAVTKGDANFFPDPLSPESAVVGVVDAVRSAGVWRSLGPAGRKGGLAVAALGTPVYRALVVVNRMCDAALRAAWTILSPSRTARGALMYALSWRDGVLGGAFRSLHALSARLTLGDVMSAPPESDAARLAIGKIDHDQTWAGRVCVEGDVVVPRGVTLRVEPGAEIVFRADSQWDCARAYKLGTGWPAEVEGKCRLLIKGRLIVEGTPRAPVAFGGARWGGIFFTADSWGSSLNNVVISKTVCAAATLTDSAQASLASSRLTDCASGVAVIGRDARATLEDCRIELCRQRGLSVAGGALSGRGVSVSNCGEAGVFAERAELELEDCTVSGSPVGLGQNGGSARLTRLKVSGAAKAAFELDDGVYELRGSSAADSGEAIRFGSGSLSLENFEADGCGSGVSQRAGELRWLGGKVSGGRFGLESAGASARIEEVIFRNQTISACRVAAGGLFARGVVVSDSGEVGVFAERSELELEDCALSGSPVGLGQNGGSARLTGLKVSGAAKAAYELDDGVFELRGSSAADSGEAIRFGSGSLSLANFEADGCGSGVSQRAGELRWLGGKASGGRFGLESAGGSARVEGVFFRNQTITACRAAGGALTARGNSLSDAASLAIGKLDDDQTWAGRVRVEGDVVVPRGVTLRVEAGAEIVFRADSQWDCSRAHNPGAGWPAEVEGKCRLLIEGRLIVEGTPRAPVAFGGEDWGGINFTGDSRGSSLSGVVISKTVCAAATLTGSAQASLASSRLRDCASGVAVTGRGARATLEDCRIELCRQRGLSVADGALSGRGVAVSDCGEAGVFAERAELELEDCTVSGSPVGLGQNGGSARLTRLRVSGAAKAAFELDDGVYELRGSSAADSGEAIRFGSGSLSLENFEADGCGSGVSQRAGELRWLGGKVSGGRFGLESAGRRAEVEAVAFHDQSLAACRVEGGDLSLRDARVERALRGLDVSGGAALLRGVSFVACVESALGADSGAVVRAERLIVAGSSDGITARDAELAIEGLELSDCAVAAIRSVNAKVELRRAVILGGASGVLAEKGSTRLDDCVLRGQAAAAAFQNGGSLVIAGGAIEGPGTGVRLARGRLELSGARLEGAVLSVECEGPASLVWRRGSLTGGGVSLGPGVEGELEDITVARSFGHGAQVAGSRLTARGCRFEDVSQAGVYVSGGGSVELADCSMRRLRYGVGAADGDTRLEDVRITGASEVGFTAGSGRHRLARVVFHGCADRIHAADGAILELVEDAAGERGASSALKRALREAVLRTRRLPFFGAAYRATYVLPVRALQLWSALDANAAGLYAHRSWTGRDWDPGLSDVDLIVAARDLSGEAGRRWLARFWRIFLGLKRFFPFLSECLVVEPGELDGYARWGGYRSRGFADQLSTLSGVRPRADARPSSPKAALEPAGELAHAYTRLMSSVLWRPEPSQAGRSAARNAALDVLRLSEARADGGPAELMTREAAFASSGAALRAPLAALAASESPRARAEICAEGLLRLHDGASRLLAAWPAPGESSLRWSAVAAESSPGGDVERRRRRGLAEEYARACGGSLVAGCADDVYRTCLVLDDAAASPQTLLGVFEGLSRLISSRGEPATLPIVLTASAWKIWSRLAYLESPARFLEPGDGAGDILIRAGAPLPGAWQYAWGREHLTPVPASDDLLLDLARESLATLRCVWRYQASEASPLSSGYIQHYLLGRAMGLRLLLERGVGASFFALEPLRTLYAREFPERAPGLERLWARLAERDGPAPWTELYSWVDEELRG